eukprot:CAMPEP_0118691564 /NCGR_PEP_ID=MMETSP0800-20121206/10754_1 /TAXON_ID=210618 ORGANISM="Striatella unipunctata, Strain CCMP2910" /NCGR_SAMPLE_ID=MMETSP0800 /ASSEMBLY_ACC=CAM_ASM_000638 /LENGTH=39 /DNA_ID= /DNA_START= /DNA_END= /DNA_ORIENTATION=
MNVALAITQRIKKSLFTLALRNFEVEQKHSGKTQARIKL